mmetsp:Transcript_9627/g.16032  ORF Transcript_9627/g.16032 Transcript_9627/m.16032 type:complete len:387 (-) Transcript_9627:608-1768(-)
MKLRCHSICRIVFLVLLVSACSTSLSPLVDVIITVKTKVDIIAKCVQSLREYKPQPSILRQRIIFIDDGSPHSTVLFQSDLCRRYPEDFLCLKTKPTLRGYTRAINMGIRVGTGSGFEAGTGVQNHSIASSVGKTASTDRIEGGKVYVKSEAVVLLNSDTVVTRYWLESLFSVISTNDTTNTLNSTKPVALVGPISNAATFQSVPHIKFKPAKGKNSTWSTNPLPKRLDVQDYAHQLRTIAQDELHLRPVPFGILNGFCLMISRSALEAIGPFDEKNFPSGYGEEVDYAVRAHQAGFISYVVPSVFIYHQKTASFTERSKKALKKTANKYLKEKYDKAMLAQLSEGALSVLSELRQAASRIYGKYEDRKPKKRKPRSSWRSKLGLD